MSSHDGCMADYYDPDYSFRGGYPDEGRMAADRRDPWLRASEVESFLGQRRTWRNALHETVELKDIDRRYARNILRFLERKSPDLLDAAVLYRMYAESEMDIVTTDPEEFGDKDPVRWIRSTNLYKAIKRRAA